MGMYDDVDFKMKCPVCKSTIKYFQSKDGFRTLSLLKIKDVKNWYSSCHECGLWVEFTKNENNGRIEREKIFRKIKRQIKSNLKK